MSSSMGRIITWLCSIWNILWKIKHVPNHQPDQIRIITWMWRPQLQISQNYSIASGDAVTSGPTMTTTCCIEQFIPEHPTAAKKKTTPFSSPKKHLFNSSLALEQCKNRPAQPWFLHSRPVWAWNQLFAAIMLSSEWCLDSQSEPVKHPEQIGHVVCRGLWFKWQLVLNFGFIHSSCGCDLASIVYHVLISGFVRK